MAVLAGVLRPSFCITAAGGPMKVTPCASHSDAKTGSSARNPQPWVKHAALGLHGGLNDALPR